MYSVLLCLRPLTKCNILYYFDLAAIMSLAASALKESIADGLMFTL